MCYTYLMQKEEDFIEDHKFWFQSLAVFPSWIVAIYAGFTTFIGGLLVLMVSNMVLAISTIVTFVAILAVAILTIKEKKWSCVGWVALAIAMTTLMFAIPNGTQLMFLVFALSLMAIFSYFAFAYREIPPLHSYIIGAVFLLIFLSHVYILHAPQSVGIEIKGNELMELFTEKFTKIAEMDPVEFAKTEKGRDLVMEVYDLSPFISDEKMLEIVRSNPNKLASAQQALLYTTSYFGKSPFGYILNVYLSTIINSLKKE